MDYTFGCTYPLAYTEGRDSAGHHLGLVQPGDIRDLDQAPDQHWHETTDEDRAALAAREAAQDAGESGSGDEAAEPAPEPDQPAAPEPETPEQTEPGF